MLRFHTNTDVSDCQTHMVAFAASRALIDTLKAEVPIWKEQLFESGAAHWVGLPADAEAGATPA